LHQQQNYVQRLIDIESKRVSAEVDHPLLLTHAKLLRARTRLQSQALGIAERKAREAFSALVGRAPDQAGLIENSMPLLPDNPASTVENRDVLRQFMAYRDIVQLDYVAGHMNRLKVTHDMELARASIGTLVAAHIDEAISFIALLQLNNQIRMAKIQFLGASDDLEAWAYGRATPHVNQAFAPPESVASDSSAPSAGVTSGAQAPSLLSILIAPAIKELPVGKSQQFSAVATYINGRVRDITSEANWSCSTDTGAVLSSTGLLTGLSLGAVTIHVEFQGLKHSRKLTVTEQAIDEYLLPDHRNAIP
jgi:hypothetical protein